MRAALLSKAFLANTRTRCNFHQLLLAALPFRTADRPVNATGVTVPNTKPPELSDCHSNSEASPWQRSWVSP